MVYIVSTGISPRLLLAPYIQYSKAEFPSDAMQRTQRRLYIRLSDN